MKYNPDIIKSDRKTISLEIRPDGKITLRVPQRMTYREIEKFLEERSQWIEKSLSKCTADENAPEPFTQEELKAMADKALEIIPARVAFYAEKLGVTYGKITIRNPKTRWGSCSSAGNLNFSCLLVLMPDEVLDSVVVHELCHRKEMNHSKRFYDEILKVMPDYKKHEKWLKENGFQYMRRL